MRDWILSQLALMLPATASFSPARDTKRGGSPAITTASWGATSRAGLVLMRTRRACLTASAGWPTVSPSPVPPLLATCPPPRSRARPSPAELAPNLRPWSVRTVSPSSTGRRHSRAAALESRHDGAAPLSLPHRPPRGRGGRGLSRPSGCGRRGATAGVGRSPSSVS